MTVGNGMNNFKRVLIIALCSILCICTVPRFSLHSEAANVSTLALRQSIMYMISYLSSRGYSIAHEYGSSIPSVSELKDMTLDQLGQYYWGVADKLNAFGQAHDLPGAGDQFLIALEVAYRTGALKLSSSLRDTIDWWLADSTVDGSVSIGSISSSYTDYINDSTFNYIGRIPGTGSFNMILDCDSIPMVVTFSGNQDPVFLVLPSELDSWSFNAAANRYEIPFISYDSNYFSAFVYFTYNNKNYYLPRFVGSSIPAFDFSTYKYNFSSSMQIEDYLTALFNLLYSGTLPDVESGSLVSTQITDTSETDLLTSTNTIASDGTVEGDTTIYLPDQATLETAIDGYNDGTISYEDFLKIFGINSVASDATVQEKEDALTVVVTPSEDYLWFTQTQWGSEAIEETRKASAATRAEEDSLADSIARTANGGSDPEDNDNKSRGKGLLALLLIGLGIWNTPIIAGDGTPSGGGTDDGSGDDGSGDTSGYLAESIAGMAVAGSLVDDLFDSAGGSDGYGLIYTVGASFVIFSVIIGAANYFGALFHGSDTKQNIKASGKKSNPGKEKKGG